MDAETRKTLLAATFEIMRDLSSLQNSDPDDADTDIPYYTDRIYKNVEIMQDIIIRALPTSKQEG